MRWFVVLLVVANLILFIWLEQEEAQQTALTTTLPPPDVGRLQLVGREAEQAATETGSSKRTPTPLEDALASAPAQSDSETEGAEMVESATEQETGMDAPLQASVEPVEPGHPDLAAVPDLPAADGSASAAPAAAEMPEVAHEPVVPPEPDNAALQSGRAAPASMGRPGDDAGPGVASVTAPAPDGAADQASPVEKPSCARVGPLSSEFADGLRSRLPPGLSLVSEANEKVEKVDTYYVLIPPLPSMEEGQVMLDKLAAAGIKDTWLFRGTDLKRAISLGLFSLESGAKRRLAEVQRKGFEEARLHPRTKVVEQRWFVLRDAEGRNISQQIALPEDVQAMPVDCP